MKDNASSSIGSFLYKKRLNGYFFETANTYFPEKAKRWKRLSQCCNTVAVRSDNHAVIEAKYYCHDPLCPLCQAKKARERYIDTFMATKDYIEGYDWYMVTLTIVNPTLETLLADYDKLSYGVKKLHQSKLFKNVVGGIKSFETTFNCNPNSKAYHTFHPHFHILVCVKAGDPLFTKEELLKQWQKNFGDNNISQVDITKCTGDLQKSLAEVSKYACRVDWSKVKKDDCGGLLLAGLMALAYKKTFSYFGCLRSARSDVIKRKKEDLGQFRRDYLQQIFILRNSDNADPQEVTSKELGYFVPCDRYIWRNGCYNLMDPKYYSDYYSNIVKTDLPDEFKKKYDYSERFAPVETYIALGDQIVAMYTNDIPRMIDITDDPVQYVLESDIYTTNLGGFFE